MPPSGGQRAPYVAAALTFLAAASKVSFRRSQAFVPSVRHHVSEGARPNPVVQRQPAASASTATSAWALSLPAIAVAAAGARRRARTSKPSLGLSPVPVQESLVTMASIGGRRARLGVRGKVCMLTGKRKKLIIKRTFTEKVTKRYQRPNIRWKKLWWEREQKWVKLHVSTWAIKRVDHVGLEEMAFRAGLDLYAWSRNHWERGSTQPLPLRVGITTRCRLQLRRWKHYLPRLNQGAALMDVFHTRPKATKSMRNLVPKKYISRKLLRRRDPKPPTPLKMPVKKFPERLMSNKFLNIKQRDVRQSDAKL